MWNTPISSTKTLSFIPHILYIHSGTGHCITLSLSADYYRHLSPPQIQHELIHINKQEVAGRYHLLELGGDNLWHHLWCTMTWLHTRHQIFGSYHMCWTYKGSPLVSFNIFVSTIGPVCLYIITHGHKNTPPSLIVTQIIWHWWTA